MSLDSGKTDEEGNPITETAILEVPAQIVDERTLVPLRAISESFGLNVDWDEDNRKVIITSDDDEDGAIYSKENLKINGDGVLYISSPAGHGIKASDNLTIENGYITIDAALLVYHRKTEGIFISSVFVHKICKI